MADADAIKDVDNKDSYLKYTRPIYIELPKERSVLDTKNDLSIKA